MDDPCCWPQAGPCSSWTDTCVLICDSALDTGTLVAALTREETTATLSSGDPTKDLAAWPLPPAHSHQKPLERHLPPQSEVEPRVWPSVTFPETQAHEPPPPTCWARGWEVTPHRRRKTDGGRQGSLRRTEEPRHRDPQAPRRSQHPENVGFTGRRRRG